MQGVFISCLFLLTLSFCCCLGMVYCMWQATLFSNAIVHSHFSSCHRTGFLFRAFTICTSNLMKHCQNQVHLFLMKLHKLVAPLNGHFMLNVLRNMQEAKLYHQKCHHRYIFQCAWIAIFPWAMLWKLFSNGISFYIGISVTYHPSFPITFRNDASWRGEL